MFKKLCFLTCIIVLVSIANNYVMRVTPSEFSPGHSSMVELSRQLSQFEF